MPKILTYNSPPGFEKNLPKDNIFKGLWEWFGSQERYAKFFILTALLILIATPFVVNNLLETTQRAEGPPTQEDKALVGKNIETAVVANELLVKVKKQARGVVNESTLANIGVTSLNELDRKHNIKKVEKVAKVAANSNTNAEIFGWYRVKFEVPTEGPGADPQPINKSTGKPEPLPQVGDNGKIKVKIDKKTGRFSAADKKNEKQVQALDAMVQIYTHDPNIEAAEPNYIVSVVQDAIDVADPAVSSTPTTTSQALTPAASNIPNDPYYSSTGTWGQPYPDLWGMHKINAEGAWSQTTGSTDIIVADVDTGVYRTHPDLAANMWTNPGEIPNNGIDDDHNGYIDDYYGWDFTTCNGDDASGNCAIPKSPDGDPNDEFGHGTHTVGTIGGVGNNGVGVVGVNWKVKIMALKFINAQGWGTDVEGAEALRYAADMGARVSSNSWGGPGQSKIVDDAINYEHDKGMIIVVAAGNSTEDALLDSPSSSDMAITVSASSPDDTLASFSNFGEKIDVAAPGVDILSTIAPNSFMYSICSNNKLLVGTNYCRLDGTSMATPHVAGLAALLLAKNPNLTNEEVRQIIRTGADDLGVTGKDKEFGYGRINAGNSMNLVSSHVLAPLFTSLKSRTTAGGIALPVYGSVTGSNFANFKIEAGEGHTPVSWTTLLTSTNQVTTNGLLGNVDTTVLKPNILYTFRITATDTFGKTFQFAVYDLLVDNYNAKISNPSGAVSLGTIQITGTAATKFSVPFGSYKIEWGQVNNGSVSSWSNAGITLANGGNQSVNDGPLGVWGTSSLTSSKVYALRLTLILPSGISSSIQTEVLADKDIVSGWPKPITSGDCYDFHLSRTPIYGCKPTPVMADLDGDGTKEVIIVSPNGGNNNNKINVFRKDGSNFLGFPVIWSTGNPNYIESFLNSPNVADVDGDGKKEIIATSQIVDMSTGVFVGMKTYVIRSDGTFYPGWPNPILKYPRDGTPAVADLDGDGKKELVTLSDVVSGNYAYSLHAFHLDGSELTGFPKFLSIPNAGSYTESALTILDMDHDGKPEIAIESVGIWLFDNTGRLLSGWPKNPVFNSFTTYGLNTVASGDVDGDGKDEILATLNGAVWSQYGACGTGCWAVDYGPLTFAYKKNGTLLPGWPKPQDCNSNSSCSHWSYYPYNDVSFKNTTVSAGDINGDGKDEAVGGFAYLDLIGNSVEKTFDIEPYPATSAIVNPAMADIDGDGRPDFLAIGLNASSTSINGRLGIIKDDGTVYWNRDLGNGTYFLTPGVLSDIDNNGKMELAMVSAKSTIIGDNIGWQFDPHHLGHSFPEGDVNAFLWEIPPSAGNTAHGEWLMFGHDQCRTGNNKGSSASCSAGGGTTPTPTPTPIQGTSPIPTPSIFPTGIGGVSNISVSLTQPSYGAVIPLGKTIVLGAFATDTPGVNITKVEFYVNGARKCSDNSSPYTCNFKVGTTTGAIYTITAKAYDITGNTKVSSPSNVTGGIDTVFPSVFLTYPTNGATVTVGTVTSITATAQDTVGVSKVEFYVNGTRKCSDNSTPYSCNWTVPTGTGITYTLNARAYDFANNISNSAITVISK